jgi:hypothetical protein
MINFDNSLESILYALSSKGFYGAIGKDNNNYMLYLLLRKNNSAIGNYIIENDNNNVKIRFKNYKELAERDVKILQYDSITCRKIYKIILNDLKLYLKEY